MKISLIAAVAANRVIGQGNDLVWRLPDDFKRFKSITSGHYILMGRKTFESLGKPLPNRTHLVITRNKNYQVPAGHHVFESVEEAFIFCQKKQVDHLYIIGGREIYKQTLSMADELELTEVEASPTGDTYFPAFDKDNWRVTSSEFHPADERHPYAFTYITYKRIHKDHV
ncbi:dihydrofolate reductase [Algoriphagus sp.]|uniref:dihydrofolate reductase n=1 Tax=Algoriphagus sp. TaxID=1872435 RepID=UPI00329A35A4